MPAPLEEEAAAGLDTKVVVAGRPGRGSGGWSTTGSLRDGRLMAGVAKLRDGKVLAIGGFTGDVTTLDSVEAYDPRSGSWSTAAPMSQTRYYSALALLLDGRVLVAGGRQNVHNSGPHDTDASEIYDPAAGRWAPAASLPRPLDGPLTFVRPDGKVLVVGGGFADGVHTQATELYDPATDSWHAGPPMTAPRITAAGVVLKDGRFFVAGGSGNGATLASAEIYDPEKNGWTATAPMSTPRYGHTLTVLPDGRILAAGGATGNGTTSSAEVYDPATDAWMPAGQMRGAHNAGASALVDGKVFVVGGSAPRDAEPGTDVFDPATWSWSPGPAMSNPRTMQMMTVLDDGRLLVFGGAPGGFPAPELASAETLTTSPRPRESAASGGTYVYDIAVRRWSPGPPLPRVRGALALAATARGLFAIGGSDAEGQAGRELDVLEHGRWKQRGILPFPVSAAAAAVLNGKIYVAGGSSDFSTAGFLLPDFREYDPGKKEWVDLPPLPTPRSEAAAAALGGKLFVIGGRSSSRMATDAVEVYDAETGAWSTGGRLPRPARSATASVLDGRLFVIGGAGGDDNALSTVQVYDPKTGFWSVSETPRLTGYTSPAAPAPLVNMTPVLPAPRYEQKRTDQPHDYALVIGVGAYKSLPIADYAENDAREMASALQALGVPEENIVTLTGAKATLSEVSKYIEEWLPKRVSKDSRVYFYFSGHGSPDVKDGSAYLMPWDGDAAFVRSTGFPLTRLYAALGELPAARVTAMIDSCFSGAGGRSVLVAGVRPLVTVKLPTARSPKITVLTASEGEEIAGSLPERGHGLFSYHLLQGLAGGAVPKGGKHLTVGDLYGYVRKRVIIDARKQNREQTPTLVSPDPKLRLY